MSHSNGSPILLHAYSYLLPRQVLQLRVSDNCLLENEKNDRWSFLPEHELGFLPKEESHSVERMIRL